jgi:mitochondrial import receptor subunit TOM7
MQPGTKQRLTKMTSLARTAFHWGFIPTVLYLGTVRLIVNGIEVMSYFFCSGFKKGADPGMAPLTIFSLLWQ